jgi:hypothetical protein
MDPYIPENLMRDLVGHDRQPSAFLLYFHLWWRTSGQGNAGVAASLQTLAAATGLSKRTLQNARQVLLRRKLIAMDRSGATDTPEYRVLSPWVRTTKGRPGRSGL